MSSQDPNFSEITRKASKTFYIASLLYPTDVRRDIHILYSFLRVSDDMVDTPNVDVPSYEAFKHETRKALAGQGVTNPISQSFADLIKRRNMDAHLVWDYFASQDVDLRERSYNTYSDLSTFIYGVAEVVGLYMAQIMGLSSESYPYARKLGEAMQLVNIIRDIDEDTKAGKCYIPANELRECGITESLSKEYAHANPDKFRKLMHIQLDRALRYIQESRTGLRFFPKKYLLPIIVSMDLYEHVVARIHANPHIIFENKVRPNVSVILITILSNWVKISVKK